VADYFEEEKNYDDIVEQMCNIIFFAIISFYLLFIL